MTDQLLSEKFPASISGMRWPTPFEGKGRVYLDGVGSARSRRASPRERLIDYLNWRFYGDNRDGRDRAENIAKYLEMTPLAVPNAAFESGRAIREGDYGNAVIPGIVAAAPFLGSFAKGIGASIKRRHSANHAIEDLPGLDLPKPMRKPGETPEETIAIAAARDHRPRRARVSSAKALDPGEAGIDPKVVFTKGPWPAARSSPWLVGREPLSLPRRDFVYDYPSGARTDDAGNLLEDIDGRKLTAKHIAGRRKLDEKDWALTGERIRSIVRDDLKLPLHRVAKDRLPPEAFGDILVDRAGNPRGIAVWDRLPKDQTDVVISRALSRIIYKLTGKISDKGLRRELNDLYSLTGLTGQLRPKRLLSPKHLGYGKDAYAEEKMTEAIDRAMVSPNTLKTFAPKTAAVLRKHINSHPVISKFFQTNSLPAGLMTGAAATTLTDTDKNAEARTLPPDSDRQMDGTRKIALALQALGLAPSKPVPDALFPIARALASLDLARPYSRN